MLRRLGIRSKVLAVLAVPMLVVLLAGVFISFEAIRDLRDARTARQVVDLVATYVPLNAALNDERVASQTGASPEDISAARGQTNSALSDFQEKAESIDLSRYSTILAPRLDEILRQMSTDLPQIRANIDNAQMREVSATYTRFVATQLELIDTAAHELTDRQLSTYLSAYAAIARTADGLAQEYIAGRDMLTRTLDAPAAGQSFATLASQTELLRGTARTAVDDLGIADLTLPTRDPSAAFTQIRNVVSTGSVVQMSAVSPTTYAAAFTEQNESFREVSDAALSQAATVAGSSITAAWQRTLVTIGIVGLAAAASLVLALVVSRAIVIPLRRLTAAATDVREELPRLVDQVQVPGEGPQMALPQIPVTTRDEVGRLAAAFNAVNATTVQVAQEQAALRGSIAEMFVNVARRDQVLLNRQLSFIDSLERTEEDPQSLANLFRLDHLATRMRRNAESLLVLAGIDSGRRLRDALPLSDVVRTASSEIEQYDRIQLDLQADPHMLGFNALPAAHLLAELLENATVFSEPETPVVVTTAVAGPYVEVRILDEGLGMTEAELAAANEKIVSTSASDALGAQRLGLYVVGRLAQRLSAEVLLRKSLHTTTGTETVVRFPATLFQSTEASPLGTYGGTAGASANAADAPVVTEVDLSALTDGTTAQGLPRRRTADSASGLPTRTPARGRGNDEGIVLPPVAAPDSLPADLSAASDWSPVVQSDTSSGLPSRTPSAAGGADVAPATGPAPAADPAARAGLFAGFFRGRGEAAAAQQAASDEAVSAAEPAHAAPANEVPFVVPGLMPEDEADTWVAPEPFDTRTTAPGAWAADEAAPAWEADEAAPAEAGWPTGGTAAPAADTFMPAAFAPEPVFTAPPVEAADSPAELAAPDSAEPAAVDEPVESAPTWAAETPTWSVPAPAGPSATETPAWAVAALDETATATAPSSTPASSSASTSSASTSSAPAWPSWAATPSWNAPVAGEVAPATHLPEQPAPAAGRVDTGRVDTGWDLPPADEPATPLAQDGAGALVEPWAPPTLEPWTAPATDTGQWPVVTGPAPTNGDASADFADLPAWPAPAGFESGDGFGSGDGLGSGDDEAYAPFERSLDEARAWATGSLPPVTDEVVVEQRVVEQPAHEPPATEPPAADAEGSPWAAWSGTAAVPVPDLDPEVPAWEAVGQGETTVLQPVADQAPAVVAPAEPSVEPAVSAAPAAAVESQAAEPQHAEPQHAEPPADEPFVEQSHPDEPVATPAWGAIPSAAPTGSFSELVHDESPEPKRRRGLFGRRVKEPKQAKATPAAPAPVEPSVPVRSSAWAPAASAPAMPGSPSIAPLPQRHAPVAPAAETEPVAPEASSDAAPAPNVGALNSWSPQASWNPPPSAALPDLPSAAWSPPEWAPRPAAATSAEAEPVADSAPASETRIGTLDDEVAAMLALRSDIQEQALSELSQLSAYRPQVVHGSERLTRRVPAAVPEAAPDPSAETSTAIGRDPEELRSRLASFQSGTARGRREADHREPGETS